VTDDREGALAKTDDALAGAAVSAAVGLALYGLRKALARAAEEDSTDERSSPRSGPFLPAVLESRADALLPLAEHAAVAAGRWVAKNSPAVVRERILPRFIESFQDAA
jgi:hypothetical protein